MLAENPHMLDINVDHWRNLQSLVLQSAKERPRIIVIHDAGRVRKLAHSEGLPVHGALQSCDDPRAAAEQLYAANRETTDFVAVFERRALDDFFSAVQDSWSADEDLDVFVHRQHKLLDAAGDGIIVWPGTAGSQLGLQWRVGATHEQVVDAVGRWIAPDTTVAVTITDADAVWATLVVSFDQSLRADVITTVAEDGIPDGGSLDDLAGDAREWAQARYRPVSVGLVITLDEARGLLAAPAEEKLARLSSAREAGAAIVAPLPEALGDALTRAA